MTTIHDPEQLPVEFAKLFNAGNAELLDTLYEDEAVLVPQPGMSVTGPARAAANGHMLKLGASIAATVRRSYLAGDLALLLVDWTITGPNMRIEGTATDIARRGEDGGWRYAVDNPFGIA